MIDMKCTCAYAICMSTIRYIRKELLGVSQSELASIAETTQTTVSRWEAGELFPDLAQLSRIRDAVKAKGGTWRDEWFFEIPAGAAA